MRRAKFGVIVAFAGIKRTAVAVRADVDHGHNRHHLALLIGAIVIKGFAL